MKTIGGSEDIAPPILTSVLDGGGQLHVSGKKPPTKGKVVPVLNLALRHEDVWGSEGIAPTFLFSALERGEWSAACPGEKASDKRYSSSCA
jgi:hypothetical protein